MTPGDLSTFIIYAIFVGGNIGGLAGTIGQLVQVLEAHPTCRAGLLDQVLLRAHIGWGQS